MPISRCAIAAVAVLLASPAFAAGGWTIDKTGGVSASIANKSGNMVLILAALLPIWR